MRRALITGRGVISSIGRGVPDFLQGLQKGRLGIRELHGLPAKAGAPVADYVPEQDFGAEELALLDRSAQFALISARQAVQESGLDWRGGLGPRAAVILGSGSGSICSVDAAFRAHLVGGQRRLHPLTVPRIMANAPAGHLSLAFGVTGPAFVVATACASSAFAIAMGLQMIRSGAIDIALVGGTEACLVDGNLKGWEALRVLAPDTCRPFSRGRRGLVLGEGAAMLVLESLEHARARNATVLGEVAGCALNSDAHHILTPSEHGQARAISACLQDAGVQPEELAYVNAHGTATTANDVTETRALKTALADAAGRTPVSSTKSMHGHALGAGGALEVLATQLALQERFAPPTMNYVEPDPECDLNCVPNEAQTLARRTVGLSNSFAFGGHNAVLALRAAAAV